MRSNEEMSVYIEELIEHERTCELESCALCASAQNVYRLVSTLVFSEVVFPQVTIAKQREADANTSTALATTVSMPRAA
jgi:hypothetical protein